MKNLLSLLLALILLALPFASCSKGTNIDGVIEPSFNSSTASESSSESETEADSSSETTADTTDALPEVTEDSDIQTTEAESSEESTEAESTEETFADGKTRLSSAGKATYRVIRPKSGDITKNVSKALTDALTKETSVTFEMKADNYPIKQDKEILVGYTDREETASVFSDLKVGGWTVREVNDKIVVYGTTAKALDLAAGYFASKVRLDDNGNVMLDIPEGGYTYVGEEAFFNESNPLSEYTIVAPTALTAQANTLKTKIKAAYGVELTVKASTSAATDKEILIGDCGRGIESSILDASTKKTAGYIVKTNGTKLIFNSHLSSSVTFAVSEFVYNYLNDEFSDEFQLPVNFSYSVNGCYNVNKPDGAEVRVMSFNVLADAFSGMSYNGTPDLTDRYPHLTATIFSVMPDVIGFQELDFFTKLSNTLSSNYTMINTALSNTECWNCIAYNKNTLKLIENGTLKYSHTNQGVKHKNISWAVFELKSTGEKFVFVNSHWDISGKTPDYRPEQAGEVAAKVNELRKKYNNCPAFTTGDYNSPSSSTQVNLIKTNASLTDAIDTATSKVNHSLVTYHDVNNVPASGSGKIDYILHTSNAKALLYYNLAIGPAVYASDHCPIFADFKLN